MEGVTILNTYEYLTNTATIVWLILLCLWFFALSFVALFALFKYKSESWKEPVLFVICAILTIICGCLIPEYKYETRYQVTTDDSVSINEFQNKYEIIKVEGKIYTVRERVK